MARQEEPLGEVSLNTPARYIGMGFGKRPVHWNKENGHISDTSTLTHMLDTLNKQICEVATHSSTTSLPVSQLHDIIVEFYTLLKKIHSTNCLKTLVKQHLMIIVQLLNDNDVAHAEVEILSLYNETNLFKAQSLHGILLADFTACNEYYLSTLKVLSLQVILKRKCVNEFQQTILKVFAHDRRYILKSKNLKIHTLVKLILNFFTVLPSYKVLFGLKFLQYINQFKLPYGDYIKNMQQETFANHLIHHSIKNTKICESYLNAYYIQYSLHNQTVKKLMMIDLTGKNNKFNDANIYDNVFSSGILKTDSNENLTLSCISQTQLDKIICITRDLIEQKPDSQEILSNTLHSLIITWEGIRNEGFMKSKNIASLLDRTLSYVNTNLPKFDTSSESLLILIKTLSEFCLDNCEFKRLSNTIIVLFNCSVTLSNQKFLETASDLEVSKYLIENEPKSYIHLIKKFEKFLVGVHDLKAKLTLLSKIFNYYILLADTSFFTLIDYCQNLYVHIFSNLKLRQFFQFQDCSEVMTALVFGYSSIKDVPTSDWSNITNIVYSCISGVFDDGRIEINEASHKWHILNPYEILIKSAYLLGIEMSRHSTTNLGQITNTFIDKWMVIKVKGEEKVSLFEIEFMKNLLTYLNFNNFYQFTIIVATNIKKIDYYNKLILDADKSLLNAYVSLKMVRNINHFREYLPKIIIDMKTSNIEKLINYLSIQLQLFATCNNFADFEILFSEELPKVRSDIFDVKNVSKMPASIYIKILLFNIQMYQVASKLQMNNNNVTEAIIEGKRALKLSVSLIKKSELLSENCRLSLISLINKTYINLIEQFIRIGISKDSEFYSKELSTVICNLGEPTAVYEALNFLYEYYKLTEQYNLANSALMKANKTFDYIDGRFNINASINFLYQNDEKLRINESLKLYFGNGIDDSFLPEYWRLRLGQVIDEQRCIPEFEVMNNLNKFQEIYHRVNKQMEIDPFFKNMFESVIAIPSCSFPVGTTNVTSQFTKGSKKYPNPSIFESPRSSNMTPKGKSLKQKFDRVSAINTLQSMKYTIENLALESLKIEELVVLSSQYSLSIALLSNIMTSNSNDEGLRYNFALSNLSKYMPMKFDMVLNEIENNIYEEFQLLPIKRGNNILLVEKDRILTEQKQVLSSKHSYNVISVDICPVTHHLLLTKIESNTNRHTHLRLPLNRTNSRDLDALHFTFTDASEELKSIIEESNNSTSLDVTTNINTKEERKNWWELRYKLDERMKTLLENIEACWFSGFRGFLDQEIIDNELLNDFKKNFYQILHQNLPTRKQFGNPSMFIQIEDWILELLVKLDLEDENIFTMLEDLIYFILDILLFHGEENAYDELDINVIFVQLEEQIKRYQSRLKDKSKVSHTFLIISNVCHNFPWENLSFLRDCSVTRVPSFSYLQDLLSKHQGNIIPTISLQSKISMILNPNGDLKRTEFRFKDQFQDISSNKPLSQLLSNARPDEKIFLDMLTNSNLFIYVGHGGGEQYIRSKEIKKSKCIAPSFLLGCSSASMKWFGRLEPTGTICSYLQGGCPLVVGNLWDVTDKDIDKFSKSIFAHINIDGKRVDALYDANSRSITMAVLKSRDICHLRFLNGAAPVIYGLPFIFE